MKVLLTGGSGFLGSALALHLHANGSDVALLLRPSSRLNRLHGLETTLDIGRCVTDTDVDKFVQRIQPDVVIHTACSYGRNGESLLQISDTNVRFGLQILQSLKRIEQSVTFINTGTVIAPEVNFYALTKHQFVQWCRALTGPPYSQLRFVNVLLQHMYGPGDDTSKFTSHVLHSCHRNDPVLKLTSGEQKRDFIYIDDVLSAFLTLAQRRHELESSLDIEVGSGFAPTVREFVEITHRLTASSTQLRFGALPYRINEAMHCQADLARMINLGWKPLYDLETGLKKTIEMEFSK